MASLAPYDFPYLDTFSIPEMDWDGLPSASSSQFSIDLSQLLGEREDIALGNLDPIGADHSWDYNALLTAPRDQPSAESAPQNWHSLSAPFRRQLATDLADQNGEQQVVADRTSNRSCSTDVAEPFRLTPPESVHHAPTRDPPTPTTTKQASRRQNRSCDPCRSSKRACDLSNDISIRAQRPSKACSLCKLRGVECTVTWLVNKQSEKRAKKRPTPPSLREDASSDLIPFTLEGHAPRVSVAAPDANLVRQTMAQETCSQHFNLYVDVFDIPISHCLFQGSMPPGYSLGVAALSPIKDSSNLSDCVNKANAWIKSCWDASFMAWGSTVPAPHVFHTVSVLDSLFQRSGTQPYRTSVASRDVAITETYKWAAIALAAQFAPGNVGQKDTNHSDPSRHLRYSHDVASAAWETAKQKVFGNIAVTSSFRVALSLLLFGLIPPPGSTDRCKELEEDAEYALCEGVRRLHVLCAQARARISANQEMSVSQNFPQLSLEDSKYVLELIGAVEWLVNIIHAVAIGASSGRTRTFIPEMPGLAICSSHETNDAPSRPGADTLTVFRLHGQSMYHSAPMPTEPEVVAFTTIWREGACDDSLLQSLRQLAYMAVVIWRSVADFTTAIETTLRSKINYQDIFQHYKTTLSLIQVWRSTFGVLDNTIRGRLQQAGCELWRMIAFTSNDTDAAILVFCDLAQRFEIRLAQQQFTPEMERLRSALRSTSAFRKKQSLISAEQASMIASTCQRMSRPGFQGSGGLKSHIQDIAAHPNPSLMVKLHTLAAKALTGELHGSISQLEGKRVSELTTSISICRQALEGLRETLVTFPDVASFDNLIAL